MFFFFKQKTAYEMRISDWSSDVCSSDLGKVLDQFSNPDNPRAHIESTGPELWKQTGGEITHFVSAMGTTGTIMEIGRASCRERVCQYVSISVVAVSLNKKEENSSEQRIS